jgi:hypothetical protein
MSVRAKIMGMSDEGSSDWRRRGVYAKMVSWYERMSDEVWTAPFQFTHSLVQCSTTRFA